jgi:hypothetical protein
MKMSKMVESATKRASNQTLQPIEKPNFRQKLTHNANQKVSPDKIICNLLNSSIQEYNSYHPTTAFKPTDKQLKSIAAKSLQSLKSSRNRDKSLNALFNNVYADLSDLYSECTGNYNLPKEMSKSLMKGLQENLQNIGDAIKHSQAIHK